jgi:hypothetical protein
LGNGGPAFPGQTLLQREGVNPLSGQRLSPVVVSERGMSLRDWFAGRCMQSLVGLGPIPLNALAAGETAADRIAKNSYAMADAMLAERVKGGAA